MEAKDSRKATPCQPNTKQRRRRHTKQDNTITLAAQLAKIERELQRKEQKLEKYDRVLKAKEHVRNTLRHHNAPTEAQGTPTTASPRQNSPPPSPKPCPSSRSVTFSTRSPEVLYVATPCHTPTTGDEATTPSPAPHPNHPLGCDAEGTHKLIPDICPVEGNVCGRGSVAEAWKDVVPVSFNIPVREGSSGSKDTGTTKERQREGSSGSKDTGTTTERQREGFRGSKNTGVLEGVRGSSPDVTPSGLDIEELGLCVQAIIEDTEHMECEEGTAMKLSLPQSSPILLQVHQRGSESLTRPADSSPNLLQAHQRGSESLTHPVDPSPSLLQAHQRSSESLTCPADPSPSLLEAHQRGSETVTHPADPFCADPAVIDGYDDCFDDWSPLPSPDPLVCDSPSHAELCSAPKSLPHSSTDGKERWSPPKSLPGPSSDAKEVCSYPSSDVKGFCVPLSADAKQNASPRLLSASKSNAKECCSLKSLPDPSTEAKHSHSTPKSLPGPSTEGKHSYSTPKPLPSSSTEAKHSYSTPKPLPDPSTEAKHSHSTPKSLPGPSTEAKHSYLSPKSLRGSQTPHSTAANRSYQDKYKGDGSPVVRSPLPSTSAPGHTTSPPQHSTTSPPQHSTTTPPQHRQHTLADEKKTHSPDLFRTQYPPEAEDVRRSYVSLHRRWRNKVSQSSMESSNGSSSSSSKRDNLGSSATGAKMEGCEDPNFVREIIEETEEMVINEGEVIAKERKQENVVRLLKKSESCQDAEFARTIVEETQEMEIEDGGGGKVVTRNDGKYSAISRCDKTDSKSRKRGEARLDETEDTNIVSHPKNIAKTTSSLSSERKAMDKITKQNIDDAVMMDVQDGRGTEGNVNKNIDVEKKTIDTFQFLSPASINNKLNEGTRHHNTSRLTSPSSINNKSFSHKSTEHLRHTSTPRPTGNNTHRQKCQEVREREGNENSHLHQDNKSNMKNTWNRPDTPPGITTKGVAKTLMVPNKSNVKTTQGRPNITEATEKTSVVPNKTAMKKTQNRPHTPPCITTKSTQRNLKLQESKKHTSIADRIVMEDTDIDRSLLSISSSSISSSIPSIRLVEAPEGTEVEAWTVPVKEGPGVLLTTALATLGTSCVLLMVQECGLGLWQQCGEGWTLLGETEHSIKDVDDIRDIRVEGLPSGEEVRYLMVAQREGAVNIEVMYIQVSLLGEDWQLSSAPLKPPVSASSTFTTCVLGEWSAAICWSVPGSHRGVLTILDFDVTYSRRGKKWELLCHPTTHPLPGRGEGAAGVTAMLGESGTSGVLICWSGGMLTLYDPWEEAVRGCIASPTTGVLWAVAVQELLFVLGQRPGHAELTLTAINPVNGLSDPFLTFTLNKGSAGVPPAALMEGGSPWRLTGVSLQPDRLILSFSGGHGAYVYFKGMAGVR